MPENNPIAMRLRSDIELDIIDPYISSHYQLSSSVRQICLTESPVKTRQINSDDDSYSTYGSKSSSSLGSPLSLSLEGEFVNRLTISRKTVAVQKMISQLVQDEARYPEMYHKGATISIFADNLMD